MIFNEAERPRLAKRPDQPVTPAGRRGQQVLVAIHDHLRHDLDRVVEAVEAVAAGELPATTARELIHDSTMARNYRATGAFCAQFCRVLDVHHTIEDQHMFPGLQREQASLAPVLDRLHWEHEVIAEVLDQFDRALVAMMNDPAQVKDVQRVADELRDALLSHLAYEEDELLEALGRSSLSR